MQQKFSLLENFFELELRILNLIKEKSQGVGDEKPNMETSIKIVTIQKVIKKKERGRGWERNNMRVLEFCVFGFCLQSFPLEGKGGMK